jgi:hypothetical protein
MIGTRGRMVLVVSGVFVNTVAFLARRAVVDSESIMKVPTRKSLNGSQKLELHSLIKTVPLYSNSWRGYN